jgi:hypothetical protein
MFFSVVKTFSRGGSEKLKRKRIQKRQFLDLIFKIKTLTLTLSPQAVRGDKDDNFLS